MEIHSVGAPLIHADRSTDLLADMKIIGALHDCVKAPKDLAKANINIKALVFWAVTPYILMQCD